MKRLNRKKLIGQIAELRHGLANAKLEAQRHEDKVCEVSFDAYHRAADRLVVELGGESVRNDKN